jgi:mycofactocin system glycosyltransferase
MPAGFRVVADPDTAQLDEVSLIGGSPRRAMRLSRAGQAAWSELCHGPVRTAAGGALARRLTDAGLLHPQPGTHPELVDVTVIIPIRDRPTMLERCLDSLGDAFSVVVVDDASTNPAAVAEVAQRHRVTLISRSSNGGPASARNVGLRGVTTELVAFLDSDCIASPEWIERLAGHFADPLVAAVAPRVVDAANHATLPLASRGSLDLGDRATRVQPGARVAYLPTAALVVRRAALEAVARDGEIFDPALRFGEDVDLIWRLDAAGWRVRYDPSVHVSHEEPAGWPARLGRRFDYGTSAAPLSRRHPTALAPLVLQTWPALAVVGVLTRRPAVALGGLAGSIHATRKALGRAEVTSLKAREVATSSIARTWLGTGRYATQFGAPVLLAALAWPASGARGWSRRLAAASLLVGPTLPTWRNARPPARVLRFAAAQVADDVAYGAGVYAGCVRHRTARPLRPALRWPGHDGRGQH